MTLAFAGIFLAFAVYNGARCLLTGHRLACWLAVLLFGVAMVFGFAAAMEVE